MPSGLSVTDVCHAVMFHISGGAASLMLMCVRPCDAGPGDRDAERCGRGRSPGTAGAAALFHEPRKGKKVQVATLRERNPGEKMHLAAAARMTFLLLFSALIDLKLQILYFPSRFLGGMSGLHAETSREALTPRPTPNSSLKLKFLDPLLNPDPHQNRGPSPFLPSAPREHTCRVPLINWIQLETVNVPAPHASLTFMKGICWARAQALVWRERRHRVRRVP